MADEPCPGSFGEDAEGRYANYFKAGHNAYEVILEFGQFYEDNPQPKMHTRIVTSPAYAKTFMDILHDSLVCYEKVFGPVAPGKPHE